MYEQNNIIWMNKIKSMWYKFCDILSAQVRRELVAVLESSNPLVYAGTRVCSRLSTVHK